MTTMLLILVLGLGAVQQVEVAPGEILSVHDSGKGKPVVLMPGLAGCAYGYRKVVPSLNEAGLRTIILEPLGFGSSARPKGADYSLTAQADRVAAVLDSLKLKNSVLVAQGVAASVAYRVAYRRPDLVGALVSIEGGPNETAGTPTLDRSLKLASLVAKLGGGRILKDKFKSNLEDASGDKSWIDRKTMGRYLRHVDRDIGELIDTLRAMSRSSEPESLHANLKNIPCPVLLMVGGADHTCSVPAGDLALLESDLKDLTITTVPGAGHFIYEEQPEAVVEAILTIKTNKGETLCVR
jgi:pimeloyl-ACP methyl ester carboxylesterase